MVRNNKLAIRQELDKLIRKKSFNVIFRFKTSSCSKPSSLAKFMIVACVIINGYMDDDCARCTNKPFLFPNVSLIFEGGYNYTIFTVI